MRQLRVLSPSRPDISVRYNPFFSDAGLYEEHSGLVSNRSIRKKISSAAIRELSYRHLARSDIHRKRYNFYDVM